MAKAGRIHDGLKIGDPGLESTLSDFPIGQAITAFVEPDDRKYGTEVVEKVTPHRALPVVLEMAQPA